MEWRQDNFGGVDRWVAGDFVILRRPAGDPPYRLVAFVDRVGPEAGWTDCDGGFFRDFATLGEARACAEAFP